MKITFLGTGTSIGVPRVGCKCAVCSSDDPKNKRLRCSLHIEHQNHSILVDTGPDLRTQALRYQIDQVDYVLFTHSHVDHLYGLDDVRPYCFDRDEPLPCYADQYTIERIERAFDYAFAKDAPSSTPQIALYPIEGPFSVCGLDIEPLTVYHGRKPILAFRIGDFAYVTDTNHIPDQTLERLRGVRFLVLDALRHKEHPTHFNIEQALAIVTELQPTQTYFTHMAHDLDYHKTNAELPESVELAYDGLVLECN